MATRPEVKEFVDAQATRCIRNVLDYKDREITSRVPRGIDEELRAVVFREVRDLAATILDVLDTISDEGVHLNSLYLEKLDELHRHVVSNGTK